jgi:probable HAF family extracellular repeat protein
MHGITRLIGSLRKGNLGICCVLLLWAVLLSAEPLWAQRLLWLGTLPGGSWSEARGISANGSVVVGEAYNAAGQWRAFRWTAAGGMQDLGTLPGHNRSYASGVSADGSVVVGWAENADWRNWRSCAYRWTASGGMQDLGTLGGNWSDATGVSADGSVVVGWAVNANWRSCAYRWTASGGMQDLGTLGGDYSSASGVSDDGSVVVGESYNATGQRRAFRWTAAGGMQDLGTLGSSESRVHDVSADGSVVVGRDGARAFRWTAAGGMQDLGTLPGGSGSEAWGVSADGSVVVGGAWNAEGQWRAFRWTAAGGMEDLNTTYASLLTNGSVLRTAYAISPNGRYIVGFGYNAATGRGEAYLLDTRPGGPSSVEEKPADELPVEYQLQQNYPNPFNLSTTIRFSIPHREYVTLKVFDVLGREVATLVDGEMNAGEHSVVLDAMDLPSGVYLFRIQVGSYTESKKLILVK